MFFNSITEYQYFNIYVYLSHIYSGSDIWAEFTKQLACEQINCYFTKTSTLVDNTNLF